MSVIDLEAIRARQSDNKGTTGWDFDDDCEACWFNAAEMITDIDTLLAEVDRLYARRWAYFSAPQYYPSGGMEDCVSRHATEAEARAAMGNDFDGYVEDLFAEEPDAI